MVLKIKIAENNTANNTSSDEICKNTQIIKIKNVHIDWFPAQINDYIKDTLLDI